MNKQMNKQIINLLQDIKMELQTDKDNFWMDIKKVCEVTSLSASTVRRAVKMEELPCSRKLGKLLFKKADVRRWVGE